MACLLLLAVASSAQAHSSGPDLGRAIWTFDLWIVAPLLVLGLTYVAGVWRLRARSRAGKSVVTRRVFLYGAGWTSSAAALVSPLHWLGEHLFTFHMIEHEILMAVSAPLLVLARPLGVFLWALPRRFRASVARTLLSRTMKQAWRVLSAGTVTTVLHGVALWAWHVPSILDRTVTEVPLHRVQHLSFLITALLFWWSMFWRSTRGVAVWHLFLTMLHMSVLGALIALAPQVLYPAQTHDAYLWGLSALEDQQLAGIVMWIPAGTVYAGAALGMVVLWLRDGSVPGNYRAHDA